MSAPADPILDRQLAVLGRLAEAGLEIAIALESQAKGGDQVVADVAMAYARVSRAVRLTVGLQSKLIRDGKAADAADTRARERATLKRQDDRKDRVERILSRVIASAEEDAEEAQRLAEEASERLDDDDIYGDILARPLSDLVADICRDLGIDPPWDELSQEAWMKAEATEEPPSSSMGEGQGMGVTHPTHRSWNVTPTPDLSPIEGERSSIKPSVPSPSVPAADPSGPGRRTGPCPG